MTDKHHQDNNRQSSHKQRRRHGDQEPAASSALGPGCSGPGPHGEDRTGPQGAAERPPLPPVESWGERPSPKPFYSTFN